MNKKSAYLNKLRHKYTNNTTGNIIMEDPTEIWDLTHRKYTHTTTEQIKSQTTTTTTTIYTM